MNEFITIVCWIAVAILAVNVVLAWVWIVKQEEKYWKEEDQDDE